MTIRPSKRPTRETRERVKRLRTNPTAPEKILWAVLRARQLGGLKFRRQHPIEPYIVDYYCAEAALVVELDGESHNLQKDHDRKRTTFLRSSGLTEFRVTNDDVLTNLDGVASAILRIEYSKLGKPLPDATPTPTPSPQGRGI
jgi:very-short-patch-repair endonuclease